jgi:hypothetical protein
VLPLRGRAEHAWLPAPPAHRWRPAARDLDTICLCDPGHHQNSPTAKKISRHPNKARFEEAYGTEEQLLARSRKMVEQLFGLYVGVDIDAVHRNG